MKFHHYENSKIPISQSQKLKNTQDRWTASFTLPNEKKYTGLHLSSALGYGSGAGVFKLKQISGVSI